MIPTPENINHTLNDDGPGGLDRDVSDVIELEGCADGMCDSLLEKYEIRYTSYDIVLDQLAEDGIHPSATTWDTYTADVPFYTYGSVDLEFAPNYSFIDSMGIDFDRLSIFLRSIDGSVSGYGDEYLFLDADDILDRVTWQETDRGHQVGVELSSLTKVDPRMSIQLIDNAWAGGFEVAQLVSGDEVISSRDIGFTPWW